MTALIFTGLCIAGVFYMALALHVATWAIDRFENIHPDLSTLLFVAVVGLFVAPITILTEVLT